jgi:hypothetical protein
LVASIVPNQEAGTLGHVLRGKYPRVLDWRLGDDGRPRRFYRDFDPAGDDSRLVERRLKPQVLSLFAGVLAEKRYTGRRHNWTGATTDMWSAADLIDKLVGSPRQAEKYSAYLWVVAEDTVAFHWLPIEEFAQALLVRKTMTGREARALLQAGASAEREEAERLTRVTEATVNRADPSARTEPS